MLKSLTAAVVAVSALSGAATASIVDLNSVAFANGEQLTTQFLGTAGLTVSAVANGAGTSNDFAIIIDTSDPTGDPDLASPFDDVTTPGVVETLMPGNVLAVAETCSGGITCDVDDNATGGVIVFDFEDEVLFHEFKVFDFRQDELDLTLFDSLGNIVLMTTVPSFNSDTDNTTLPNLFATIDLGAIAFSRAEFDFGGSGAIGDFVITAVPLPAALPLFLAGIGLLGLGRRKPGSK